MTGFDDQYVFFYLLPLFHVVFAPFFFDLLSNYLTNKGKKASDLLMNMLALNGKKCFH